MFFWFFFLLGQVGGVCLWWVGLLLRQGLLCNQAGVPCAAWSGFKSQDPLFSDFPQLRLQCALVQLANRTFVLFWRWGVSQCNLIWNLGCIPGWTGAQQRSACLCLFSVGIKHLRGNGCEFTIIQIYELGQIPQTNLGKRHDS